MVAWREQEELRQVNCRTDAERDRARICFDPIRRGILFSTMQDPEQLILAAYEVARRSGKPDWQSMTTAVLKNRLLEITDREFDEARYGVANFMEFVSQFPDLLLVDVSEFPPIVELRDSERHLLPSIQDGDTPTVYHIRSDLWSAALDYSSGTKYLWDVDTDESRPVQGSETGPIIDTIDADIQRRWRQEFLEERTESFDLSDAEINQVSDWVDLLLGTSHLPEQLVHPWNHFFRDHVLGHLRGWFSKNGITHPRDLVSKPGQRPTKGTTATDELREFVISVARQMTHEELSQLKLPAESVLRTTKRRKR